MAEINEREKKKKQSKQQQKSAKVKADSLKR